MAPAQHARPPTSTLKLVIVALISAVATGIFLEITRKVTHTATQEQCRCADASQGSLTIDAVNAADAALKAQIQAELCSKPDGLVTAGPRGPPNASELARSFTESRTLSRNLEEKPEEVCITPAYPLEGPNSSWYYLKEIPPPDPCTCLGFPIERLEPDYNFRRPWTLRFQTDSNDKTYLLPYVRAAHDLRLSTRKRRVYLDLGGNVFASSVQWFLRQYPLDFTEIHVFESEHTRFRIPGHSGKTYPDLIKSIDGSARVPKRPEIPDWALDRITLHEALVTVKDSSRGPGRAPFLNITRFMLDEIKLTPDDTVIVKMDIEWAEWRVLEVWMANPEMPKIVDELFLEVHYKHPNMAVAQWDHGPPRENATQLFRDLRAKGFFTHPWP